MSEPFIGELRIVSFNFAPKGWALCNGQLLPISQNTALFSLLGTTYGGDGQQTFALPNLQGRTAVHPGSGIVLGQYADEESHTLTPAEMPMHTHVAQGSSNAPNTAPAGGVWAAQSAYSTAPPNAALSTAALASTGGGLPHPNLQPYLVLNVVIALLGVYPSQN